MEIALVNGAGATLGDDMVSCVIKDWLTELGVTVRHFLPPTPDSVDGVNGLIVGGCGIIYDGRVVVGRGNDITYHRWVMAARKWGIPAIGLGLGWQGNKLEKDTLWIETLNNLQVITCWRGGTKDYLRSIGVVASIEETTDLGFALKPAGGPVHCDVAVLTHVSPLVARDCCGRPELAETLEGTLCEVMQVIAKRHSVAIVPFTRGNWFELLRLADLAGGLLVQGEPHRILGAMTGARVCLTRGLHALITAATARCRVVALYPPEPLRPKIRWMVQELGVRALPFTAGADEIVKEIERAFDDEPVDLSSDKVEHAEQTDP